MPAAATRTGQPDAPPEAAPKKSRWIALVNLSIGRSADKTEKQADIVHRGETVDLTEEQSHGFLTRHKVPVIKPYAERREPDPDIRARDLFGPQGRPTAAQFGARPDPKGASRVIENPDPADPANHPEASDPQTDLTIDPDAAKDK
jgi:hypothetical protein